MNDLINLSVDLQVTLVGGYLAYNITVLGRDVKDRTEDLLLKVIAFGLFGKGIGWLLAWVTRTEIFLQNVYIEPLEAIPIALEIVATVLGGILWRFVGYSWVSATMRVLGVYRDDHETSTWMTLAHAKAAWNHIQIHLVDGSVVESHFAKLPAKTPTSHLTLHKDGVLLHITKIYRENGDVIDCSNRHDNEMSEPSYIPMERITQVDVSWKKRP